MQTKQALPSDYADILHLPHPDSAVHPRMPRRDRAAQFSPFAALTGYETAISETEEAYLQKQVTEPEKSPDGVEGR